MRELCECRGEGDCNGKVHAHHDDYSKPLDVRWLCAKHHGELRRMNPNDDQGGHMEEQENDGGDNVAGDKNVVENPPETPAEAPAGDDAPAEGGDAGSDDSE